MSATTSVPLTQIEVAPATLQTSGAGVVAFDLPGTSGASLLWPTGRGGYLRAGTAQVRRPDALFASGFDG